MTTARASSHGGDPWILPLICTHSISSLDPLGGLDSFSTLAFPSWLQGELAFKHHFQAKVPLVSETPLESSLFPETSGGCLVWAPPPVLLPRGGGGRGALQTPPSRASCQGPGLHASLSGWAPIQVPPATGGFMSAANKGEILPLPEQPLFKRPCATNGAGSTA